MNQFHKISEKLYLIFGLLFTAKAIFNIENIDQQFYISCILGAAAFAMFFFRIKYRKKFEKRSQ
jgi:hypothetical protein